jgi:choline dehydrogenase-like flavoprotein
VPGLVKSTPFGFHGHLAGTLPMRASPGPLESDAEGRLAGTRRVFVVDSAAFPTLPAQNLTFTAMANARRVAAGLGAGLR